MQMKGLISLSYSSVSGRREALQFPMGGVLQYFCENSKRSGFLKLLRMLAQSSPITCPDNPYPLNSRGGISLPKFRGGGVQKIL